MKNIPSPDQYANQDLEEKKRDHYDSISTDARRLLVKLTQQDGISIRKASKALQIKYSTGKTLIQQYKRTGRIDRIKQQRAKLSQQKQKVRKIIQKALTSDVGDNDHTESSNDDKEISNEESQTSLARDNRLAQQGLNPDEQQFLVLNSANSAKVISINGNEITNHNSNPNSQAQGIQNILNLRNTINSNLLARLSGQYLGNSHELAIQHLPLSSAAQGISGEINETNIAQLIPNMRQGISMDLVNQQDEQAQAQMIQELQMGNMNIGQLDQQNAQQANGISNKINELQQLISMFKSNLPQATQHQPALDKKSVIEAFQTQYRELNTAAQENESYEEPKVSSIHDAQNQSGVEEAFQVIQAPSSQALGSVSQLRQNLMLLIEQITQNLQNQQMNSRQDNPVPEQVDLQDAHMSDEQTVQKLEADNTMLNSLLKQYEEDKSQAIEKFKHKSVRKVNAVILPKVSDDEAHHFDSATSFREDREQLGDETQIDYRLYYQNIQRKIQQRSLKADHGQAVAPKVEQDQLTADEQVQFADEPRQDKDNGNDQNRNLIQAIEVQKVVQFENTAHIQDLINNVYKENLKQSNEIYQPIPKQNQYQKSDKAPDEEISFSRHIATYIGQDDKGSQKSSGKIGDDNSEIQIMNLLPQEDQNQQIKEQLKMLLKGQESVIQLDSSVLKSLVGLLDADQLAQLKAQFASNTTLNDVIDAMSSHDGTMSNIQKKYHPKYDQMKRQRIQMSQQNDQMISTRAGTRQSVTNFNNSNQNSGGSAKTDKSSSNEMLNVKHWNNLMKQSLSHLIEQNDSVQSGTDKSTSNKSLMQQQNHNRQFSFDSADIQFDQKTKLLEQITQKLSLELTQNLNQQLLQKYQKCQAEKSIKPVEKATEHQSLENQLKLLLDEQSIPNQKNVLQEMLHQLEPNLKGRSTFTEQFNHVINRTFTAMKYDFQESSQQPNSGNLDQEMANYQEEAEINWVEKEGQAIQKQNRSDEAKARQQQELLTLLQKDQNTQNSTDLKYIQQLYSGLMADKSIQSGPIKPQVLAAPAQPYPMLQQMQQVQENPLNPSSFAVKQQDPRSHLTSQLQQIIDALSMPRTQANQTTWEPTPSGDIAPSMFEAPKVPTAMPQINSSSGTQQNPGALLGELKLNMANFQKQSIEQQVQNQLLIPNNVEQYEQELHCADGLNAISSLLQKQMFRAPLQMESKRITQQQAPPQEQGTHEQIALIQQLLRELEDNNNTTFNQN